MPRRLIALAATALALATLAPVAPAQAQAGSRLCVANDIATSIRARLDHIDQAGTRTTTAWVTLAQGEQGCFSVPVVTRVSVQTEGAGPYWGALCHRTLVGEEARIAYTMRVTGAAIAPRCTLHGPG